jgi:hypothetical protein
LEIKDLKYSIECQVLSNILINKTISFVEVEKEYVFTPNEKGILNKVKIVKTISNPDKFYSEIKDTNRKNVPHEIILNEDPLIREEIILDFQYLEAHLGFIANLTRIFWNEPSIEWIPETDEERNRLKVFSAHFTRGFSNQPTELNINVFKSIIKTKSYKDNLIILMSFYREGKVFFDRFEFINAFYDFYFILEDMFGKESWRNWEIENNFKSSIELQETIKWVLFQLIDSSEEHKKEITALLKQKNLQYDVEGIIVLLVEMRGHLHHFSRRSTVKQKPNPLVQQNYGSLAFLTMAIAMQSILNEMERMEKMKVP